MGGRGNIFTNFKRFITGDLNRENEKLKKEVAETTKNLDDLKQLSDEKIQELQNKIIESNAKFSKLLIDHLATLDDKRALETKIVSNSIFLSDISDMLREKNTIIKMKAPETVDEFSELVEKLRIVVWGKRDNFSIYRPSMLTTFFKMLRSEGVAGVEKSIKAIDDFKSEISQKRKNKVTISINTRDLNRYNGFYLSEDYKAMNWDKMLLVPSDYAHWDNEDQKLALNNQELFNRYLLAISGLSTEFQSMAAEVMQAVEGISTLHDAYCDRMDKILAAIKKYKYDN